jgi:hypothetical protein
VRVYPFAERIGKRSVKPRLGLFARQVMCAPAHCVYVCAACCYFP